MVESSSFVRDEKMNLSLQKNNAKQVFCAASWLLLTVSLECACSDSETTAISYINK